MANPGTIAGMRCRVEGTVTSVPFLFCLVGSEIYKDKCVYQMIKRFTNEEIITAAESHLTMLSAAKDLGIHFNTFRYRAKRLGVYKINPQRKGIAREEYEHTRIRIPLDDIIVKGLHPGYSSNRLKGRLIKAGIKEERCEGEGCAITNEWNGKKLVLHLDHVDGDPDNNLAENLVLLCPNCHSQTPTYSGRKTKGIKKYAPVVE